ncbi:hypothetical protein MTP99_002971 [Tenebrio molitor]|nr:hypothetical protein MTP99_002971 [Tenebrio molitor]
MENELIRIPKLKGIENWAVWKFQTRVILQSSDAWSIVDGSSAIPVQGQTIDETTFNRTLAAWKKNDSIAQRIIATTVEEKPLLHILNCKSAKDMWDKLIQVYEQKSETSIHMLMQQWYNLQMKSDDDIAIYVARLEDLAHRLEIMGEKIPDQMLITKLLMTLPPTYKYFISAWESTSSDQRTLANLISRLTAEESRMSTENPENVAFASTKVNWNKPVLKGTCNYCKKPGHWIRDCKKRKAANERKAAAHHDGRNEALIGEALSTVQDIFVNQKYQDHQRDNDKDVVEVIVNHPHQEPEHEEQETPENQKLAESESEMSDEEEDESIHDSLPKTREESEQEQDPVQQDTYSLRDRSKIRNPERFANISILNAEPESFEEATSSGNAEQWKQAMDEEIQSLKQNQTWTLVEPPKNQQVIDNRWVYKIKRNEDGSVQKYKARLVARGFRQVAGVDYNETFSPVTKFDSIRMILCVAASEKLILRQFDVKTAFLYGNIDEILYMQQPDGYQDGTKRVCKLNRSLYGLKQASRCWNQRFTSVLSRLGLHPTNADACVFTNGDPKNQLILAIHIDDGLIAASRQSEIDKLLQELHQEFEITSNPVGTYLGLQIKRMDDGSIFLHQKVYAENVVQRFRMEHANSVKIPADQHHQMDPEMHTNGDKETDNKLYRQIIGSLMYLSLGTRPDITYAVNKASQFLENPRKIHWKAAKRIVKYLKGTINHGLYFPVKQEGHVYAFSDADYAGDVTSRKSTTGIVVKLGTAIIAWKSTRQKIVALSTTEAEYVAACQTVKELIWLKLLLSELAIFENFKATLHVDNESAIKLIKNPEFHQRSKHIDVRYHFIRDKYTMGEFNLVHVSSKQQQADILTKPLPRVGFEEQRRMLNVRDIKDIDEHHLQTAGPS